jgi:hypothetical protein
MKDINGKLHIINLNIPNATDTVKSSDKVINNLRGLMGNQNFLNAAMSGYLEKRAQRWFRDWSEKYCVLTNVGLLYYEKINEKPHCLFPIIDSQIEEIDAKVHC